LSVHYGTLRLRDSFCHILLGDISKIKSHRLSLFFILSIYLIPIPNSSFDLDGFAEASMDFEAIDELAMAHQPDNHLEGDVSAVLEASSDQSLQFNDKENNNSDLVVESPIAGAPQAAQSDAVRGLEREASMHLSEVFNLSDVPETPVQVAAPKGPGKLTDFLESGGTTNRLAGVRKWIKEKLDEQEDNSNDRRKSLRDQEDESERSLSESHASGTNFGGAGGWVPQSQQM
jgi:hypothetical protein